MVVPSCDAGVPSLVCDGSLTTLMAQAEIRYWKRGLMTGVWVPHPHSTLPGLPPEACCWYPGRCHATAQRAILSPVMRGGHGLVAV